MNILVIVLGLIVMTLGVRNENKKLRNVGIVVIALGCLATIVSHLA